MDDKARALDRAMRMLAARARSEQEIVDRLAKAGYDERVIAETMAKLADYHFTDDEAFAAGWAASRARKGLGPYRIARELREKGIDRETAEAVMEDFDEDAALESATALALKHLRKGDDRAKRRAHDALLRRGFSYDMVRKALGEAASQLEIEDEDWD